MLVGPTWRRVRLPWPAGDYTSGPLVVQRTDLDAALHDAAVAAGAEPRRARIADVATAPRDST